MTVALVFAQDNYVDQADSLDFEAFHQDKKAAQLCAHDWKKLSERSGPIEQDFYLCYKIECL